MSNSTLTIIESLVPNEMLRAGDYKNAKKLLEEEVSSEKLADIFYLLGNKFFSSNQKDAAELSWNKSRNILLKNSIENDNQNFFLINRKTNYIKTISIIVIAFIILYGFLLVFFKRVPENFKIGSENIFSNEKSLWEDWWDTGRPTNRGMYRRYGLEEFWPLINKALGKLFGENEQLLRSEVIEKLKKWLEFSQIPQFRQGPTDYYALIARGLFEAREFEEAVSTLNESIHFAETPEEFEKIYQDLGTVYYYRGYRLRPDGLANYNIKYVCNELRNAIDWLVI